MRFTLLAMTWADWAALATMLQTVGVATALVFAWFQVREASAARKDQGRAYVAVYFELVTDHRHFPDIVVTNFGDTAAYDVRITFTPPLRSSIDAPECPVAEIGMFRSGIPTLAPRAVMRSLFDSMIERPKDWETSYTAQVAYTDRNGDHHDERYDLDLAPYANTTWFEIQGLPAIHKELAELRKDVRQLVSGHSPLVVVTEDRATMKDRLAEEREERQRRFEEHKNAAVKGARPKRKPRATKPDPPT